MCHTTVVSVLNAENHLYSTKHEEEGGGCIYTPVLTERPLHIAAVNLAGRARHSAAGAHLGAVGARRHQLWVREVHDEDGARLVARVAHLVRLRVRLKVGVRVGVRVRVRVGVRVRVRVSAHLVLERVVEDERGALLPPAWGGDGCWD